MQGRARGRKGECKTYHITILYIQITCMYLIDYLYHILPFCLAFVFRSICVQEVSCLFTSD